MVLITDLTGCTMPRTPAPELDLQGRIAVVTGAARGLGRAETRALAARGARVVAVDVLDCAETVDLIRASGGEGVAARADVTSADGGAAVVQAALDAFGGLDIVVNNAGIVCDRMSFNLAWSDWERVLAVNLSGTFAVSRAAATWWREHAGLGRTIVNTTSESGLYGNAGQANYAAAKAGVVALTLTLAAELDRYGVRVNAIAPRARTPMSEDAFGELPDQEIGFDPFAPEHVAAIVAWLASDAAIEFTGRVLVVHGRGVELMQGWRATARVTRSRAWTDHELTTLASRLRDHLGPHHIPPPVAELFATREPR
jgi:NAD(P)-dependent dehydrogenase (short-subunit alcohol dehydrogenase family)